MASVTPQNHILALQIHSLGSFLGPFTCKGIKSRALRAAACTLPFDTKMEVCLRANVQWTLWSCWKVGHKPAMWFPEPCSYSHNLMLPKANAVTHSRDPTPPLHLLPSSARPLQPFHAANNDSETDLPFSFRLVFFFMESVLQSIWLPDHTNSCISTGGKQDSLFHQHHQQNLHWNKALGWQCNKHKEPVLWFIL